MKRYFVVYINPPRPDFASTMTDEEERIMGEHLQYWQRFMAEGKVVVFGPVFEPTTVYGLGIIAVDDEAEVDDFAKNDPASAIHTFEWHPINAIVPDFESE